MAKFCKYCGRPLAEGEVCNCTGAQAQPTQPQQTPPQPTPPQPTPNNISFVQPTGNPPRIQTSDILNQAKLLFFEFVSVLKNPFTKAQELASTGNNRVGIAGIAVKMLANILLLVVVWNKFLSYAEDMISFRSRSYIAQYLKEYGLSLPKFLFLAVVLTAGYDLLKAVLLKTFTQNVFKGKTNLNEMITVVGVQSVFSAVLLLAAMVISLLSLKWGLILYFLCAAAIGFVEPICYAGTIRMDGNKKLYSYMIVSVIMVIATAIVLRIGCSDLLSSGQYLVNMLS